MTQVLINVPDNMTAEQAQRLLALKLYEDKQVSLGRAAEIAGMHKAEFMVFVGSRGVAVYNYSPDDLEREMAQPGMAPGTKTPRAPLSSSLSGSSIAPS